DLLAEVAGQEAEPFAGLDRGARQDDAIDFLALEELCGMRDRKPGLAGAGGTDAEYELVPFQRADIGILRGSARPHRTLAQVDDLEGGLDGLRIVLEQRALRDHRADRAFDVALRDILAFHGLGIERFQHAARGIAAVARARDGDVVAARVDDDAEPALDLCEVLTIGTDQRRNRAVVIEVDDDLRLGRYLHVAVKLAAGNERGRIRCAFWQGFRLQWSFGKMMRARCARAPSWRVRRAGCNVRGCRSGPAGP